MGRMGHISIYLSISIYQIRTEYFLFVHHATSILAKFINWCFEHFGDISCSLLVNPSHWWVLGRTKHVSAYIYIHIHTYIYIYIYICIYLSFIIISFSSLNCLSDTVQSIKTFLKINHISKFTAKAMLKISIQAKIIINETILLEQNAP